MKKVLKNIYVQLFEEYGPQGWWPTVQNGYHVNDYNFPTKKSEVFEVCVGALLTQNTNWKNVSKALKNLHEEDLLNPGILLKTDKSFISELIKCSGYYNQKTNYLFNFTKEFINFKSIPSREELLNIKGVGFETADSILLYAYKQPCFVVDTYTKRLLQHHKLIESNDYNNIKKLFEECLVKDYKLFQEYHALIVEHGKNYYSKKPYGVNDFLKL